MVTTWVPRRECDSSVETTKRVNDSRHTSENFLVGATACPMRIQRDRSSRPWRGDAALGNGEPQVESGTGALDYDFDFIRGS